mmetsp:Transcript_38730/g.74383  ORF Transcript_38730/g.74383 Transcript_38730/m.74383 type:complete len:359 (-) Transcript_38730:788-1864(-)
MQNLVPYLFYLLLEFLELVSLRLFCGSWLLLTNTNVSLIQVQQALRQCAALELSKRRRGTFANVFAQICTRRHCFSEVHASKEPGLPAKGIHLTPQVENQVHILYRAQPWGIPCSARLYAQGCRWGDAVRSELVRQGVKERLAHARGGRWVLRVRHRANDGFELRLLYDLRSVDEGAAEVRAVGSRIRESGAPPNGLRERSRPDGVEDDLLSPHEDHPIVEGRREQGLSAPEPPVVEAVRHGIVDPGRKDGGKLGIEDFHGGEPAIPLCVVLCGYASSLEESLQFLRIVVLGFRGLVVFVVLASISVLREHVLSRESYEGDHVLLLEEKAYRVRFEKWGPRPLGLRVHLGTVWSVSFS